MMKIERRQCQQCGSYYGRERDSEKGYGTYEFCPFCGSNNTIPRFVIQPYYPRDLSMTEYDRLDHEYIDPFEEYFYEDD